jgi:hypothetical protein
MRRPLFVALSIIGACTGPRVVHAQTAADSWRLLVDAQTKIPLQNARFTAGTRHLDWLIEEQKSAAAKTKNAGPEYLEFREEKSTTFKDGIVTWIPLASLAGLEYDHDKKLVRAAVRQPDGKDLALVGSTKFVGFNKFNVEGAVGEMRIGVEGMLQLQDGLMKVPFRGLVHEGAHPTDPPTGRGAMVIAQDKEKSEHNVRGLAALYAVNKGHKLASVLMFQKIGQVDLAKITVLRQVPAAKKQTLSHDYDVTQGNGEKEHLTLLDKTQLGDNQPATLLGLVGRVPAGLKLFPPHTLAEVRFEDQK